MLAFGEIQLHSGQIQALECTLSVSVFLTYTFSWKDIINCQVAMCTVIITSSRMRIVGWRHIRTQLQSLSVPICVDYSRTESIPPALASGLCPQMETERAANCFLRLLH
jgi:hypothetical protein